MSFDDKLIRIEDKIDLLSNRINNIDSTLAAQHESLKEHIRRTELLENTVEPIKTHVAYHSAMISGVGKSIGAIIALLAAAESIVLVLEFLKK